MKKDTIEILEEDKSSYTIIRNGKEKIRILKINVEEIQLKHINDLQKASKYISKRNIDESLFFSNVLLENPPRVTYYEDAAKSVVSLLKRIHFDLSPHDLGYLVKSLVKDIDPNIYGKAQTFIPQVTLWNNDLKVINEFMDNKVVNKE